MLLKQGFEQSPNVKILINIGALLDIPTGTYITGLHGESILNGGLGQMTGVVGIGNNFKSTVMHYMMLSAMNRISFTTPTSASTYDTEINIHESHLRALTKRFENFKSNDVTNDGTWTFTDKTVYYANEWYTVLKEFLKSKKSNYKQISVTTPFPDRDGKTLLSIATPTFSEIDSFSEFETADIAKMQSENELGDSGANTMHMRQGLAKTRFLMELPAITAAVYHFVLMTAHVGKDIAMASGPIPTAPVKKLQNLKNGDKIKGVTDKFFFLMSNCWHAYNAAPLTNQGTKGPEYPRNPDDNNANDTDLNIVSLRQLRSKSGPSGNVIELLVSQSEGVLPELSEFHFLKTAERFGISGTLQHYALDLLPEVKLSRTTVRSKIDTIPELRRALNITAELCQMTLLWRSADRDILCTPKELYDDLIKLGYDWDMILKNTRGWWTVENDKYSQHFLSTKDLLLCRAGLYHPYWLEADKKTIKKQYLKN